MKVLKLPILLFVAAIAAFLIAQAAVAPPSGQFLINVNQSTNLNCNYIRVTSGRLIVDELLSSWELRIPYECWKTNPVPVIVSRGTLDLTMAQLKTLMNSTNAKVSLKNTILTDAALTEKP